MSDERDDRDLEVIGEIPAGLRGIFVRNGPNPQFAPLGRYHPFDGDGMVHAVYFEDGRARYRNRWVESKGLLAERKRGHSCYGGLGEFRLPDPDVAEEGGAAEERRQHPLHPPRRPLLRADGGGQADGDVAGARDAGRV